MEYQVYGCRICCEFISLTKLAFISLYQPCPSFIDIKVLQLPLVDIRGKALK